MYNFNKLTERLNNINFSEFKYWIIYHKGNPATEDNCQ